MLHFDGERMNATENGRYSGGWKAVSGEKNSQSPNQKHAPYQQHVKGEGPIPEGVFSVEELQYPPEGEWSGGWAMPDEALGRGSKSHGEIRGHG
ncbi:hypothetical protein [Sinorhizobium medicae]|uniref:hypothetical protein n=1 Tax=Sinorhizobium medicae TaxID=110321 RepID=UPI00308C9496|nr:hypothetical protein U8C38_11625 [Sinorhizobium medicae]